MALTYFDPAYFDEAYFDTSLVVPVPPPLLSEPPVVSRPVLPPPLSGGVPPAGLVRGLWPVEGIGRISLASLAVVARGTVAPLWVAPGPIVVPVATPVAPTAVRGRVRLPLAATGILAQGQVGDDPMALGLLGWQDEDFGDDDRLALALLGWKDEDV